MIKTPANIKPPVAKVEPVVHIRHNVRDEDPYAWLRDADWQRVMREPEALSPEIKRYLDAENAYLERVMAPTQPLQEELFREMKGRIKEDDSSVPDADGPYEYYGRYRTGGQHEIVCRRPRGDSDYAREQILIDGDEEAKGHAYFVLADADHSYDHKLLAYTTDTKGSEFLTLRIREIATGREMPEVIEDVADIAWAPDSQGFYYVKLDDNHRTRWVYYHKLGSAPERDLLIFEEKNPAYFVGIAVSELDEYLFIDSHDHASSEVRFKRVNDPKAPLKLLAPRRTDVEYGASQFGSTFLIVTNASGAEDFELVMAPIERCGPENWKPLIAHRRGRLLLGIDVTKRHLAWLERENALPKVWIAPLREEAPGRISLGEAHAIAFDEEAYALGMSSGYEFDTDNLRFSYSSPTTPAQVWDYNMTTRERTLRKTQEVPSGHNPADYVTQRIEATADDGAKIPITLLYRSNTKRDGTAPLLLYGYGSYGMAMPAGFGTVRLSLVDRGFVYAVAHIRGGMDKGFHWYSEGRRLNKKNTFTDFIACAEHLIDEGFTRAGRIIAQGGSAGGLLMGAVANLRPDLFLGILAEVPFVDVLNTITDASLPLTPPEWNEWGNPIESAEVAQYMRSYSPYDNVGAHDYPNMLVTAGLTDPRVTYWEPAKWVAKLRAMKTDNNLLMLKTHMEAGHGGASGRFDSLKDDALNYAFAILLAEAG